MNTNERNPQCIPHTEQPCLCHWPTLSLNENLINARIFKPLLDWIEQVFWVVNNTSSTSAIAGLPQHCIFFFFYTSKGQIISGCKPRATSTGHPMWSSLPKLRDVMGHVHETLRTKEPVWSGQASALQKEWIPFSCVLGGNLLHPLSPRMYASVVPVQGYVSSILSPKLLCRLRPVYPLPRRLSGV